MHDDNKSMQYDRGSFGREGGKAIIGGRRSGIGYPDEISVKVRGWWFTETVQVSLRNNVRYPKLRVVD